MSRLRWGDVNSGREVNGFTILSSDPENNTRCIAKCPRCGKAKSFPVWRIKNGKCMTCAECYNSERRENSKGEKNKGLVFGGLRILGQSTRKGHVFVECEKCGKQYETRMRAIMSGRVTQCDDCHRRTYITSSFEDKSSALHLSRKWFGMVRRCNVSLDNGKNASYIKHNIKVCPEWERDKEAFVRYAMTLEGHDDPSKQIDRIDNNRGYEPGNIRFVTPKINARNRRTNVRYHYRGKELCVSEICELAYPLSRNQVDSRLKKGVTVEDVLIEAEAMTSK